MRIRPISSCFTIAFLILAGLCFSADEYLFPDEPIVRTLIIESTGLVGVRPSSAATVRDVSAGNAVEIEAGVPLVLTSQSGQISLKNETNTELIRSSALRFESAGGPLLIAEIKQGQTDWSNELADRLYDGTAEFRAGSNGQVQAIVILPLEHYLRGVVPSEIGNTSPLEAQKAQAIAARGETLVALRSRRYAGEHYDICADVNCQVFSGNRRRSPESDAAVEATRALALFHEGEPIGAYYASNCGGHSEEAHLVWPDRHPEPVPYWSGLPDGDNPAPDLTKDENVRAWLESSPDAFCNPAFSPLLPEWTHKNFRWERAFSADEVSTVVATRKDIGRILDIELGERGPSGRLTKVTFVGEKGRFEIGPELAIRRLFSPLLRSSMFVVDVERNEGQAERFVFKGAGSGHGVGMCQTGAIARALAGQNYEQILTHYYQGTVIREAYPVK